MIKINVYRAVGTWFAARWIDGEYDGCDELGCDDDATDAEAIAHAALMPLAGHSGDEPREVNRVSDVADSAIDALKAEAHAAGDRRLVQDCENASIDVDARDRVLEILHEGT